MMDNEQAKLILSAYRPGGRDAADPFFTEALEQVRLDPGLGRWFAEQQCFDQAMTEAISSQPPPKNLRETLLLGNKIVSPRRPLWTQPASWLAMAAALLLFLGIGMLFQPPEPLPGPQFAREIIGLTEKITLGKMADNTDELRAWLATRGSPHDFAIPAGLRGYQGMGCQSYVVNGTKVSLVCFMLDKDRIVHLFVVDEEALKDAPGATPSIIRERDKVAATWSSGGKTYFLMGMNVGEETLRRLIS